MTDTSTFTTTNRCGSRVAGRPVESGKDGQELQLTVDEAAYELGQGTIVPKGKELSKGFGSEAPKTAKIRTEIAEEAERYAAVRAGTAPNVAAGTATTEAAPVEPPPAPAGRKASADPAKAD